MRPIATQLTRGTVVLGTALTIAICSAQSPKVSTGQIQRVSSTRRIKNSPPQGPKPDLEKNPTLYVVGYAHLDTQWLWMYPRVIGKYLSATMEDNFKLFDKYPHYTFNFTGSNRYRLMKEYYPDDYAKLKQYIAEGRWFPAGSSIEEGDVNSPSLESLVRQVMYGNEYFEKEFGKSSDEYMLPDCFGFPAALPSVLAHCGIKGFSTQKLTWGSAVGIPFNVGMWVGPDGKSVVAALNPLSYGSRVGDDLSHDPTWIKRVDDDGKECGVYADYHYFGTGDEGGAPDENSVKWVEQSITGDGPLKIVGGDANQMFDDLTPEDISKLPRYQGDLELTQHSAGSITSESEMKRWNHQNEKLAQAAEEADVAALELGAADYPSDMLLDAWTHFLTCQFHDMMAGTARPLAYTYAWNDEALSMNEFASAITAGVGGVSRGLDLSGPGVALVVYNPLSFARTDAVEATISSMGARDYEAIGPNGQSEPVQILGEANGKAHIVFLATVPSVGMAVYHIRPTRSSSFTPMAGGQTLENAALRVTIDRDGNVSSIIDKATGQETLSAPIRLAFEAEAPNQYPAWNMDWKDQQKPPYAYVDGPAKVRIVENGPVRASIEIDRDSQGSHFAQQVRLTRGSDRVEFLDKIDWKSKGCALKAVFPLAAGNPEATYNWQVGTIQRGNDDSKKYEVASHRWFDLTDTSGQYGCSVLTGSKNGSDKPDDHLVRLTLIYTPTPTGGFYEQGFQDWGHHEFLYGLYPHKAGWQQAESPMQAMRLDQPMMIFSPDGKSAGTANGKREFSLLHLSDNHVVAVAVKKAEASDEVIVRFREDNGVASNGVHLKFLDGIESAREVDGQERAIGPATVENGELVFDMTPYTVRAFALTLRKPSDELAKTSSQTVDLPYNLVGISDRSNRSNGDFDGQGRTVAGDQLPADLNFDTVQFKFGPRADGEKNAIACNGQAIELPRGSWRTVCILAASSAGDREANFKVGETDHMVKVQDWGGHIGEWDTRVWEHPQADVIYDWQNNPYKGLVPGYMKMEPVAWACDHRHDPSGDEIYQYSYLFKYEFPLDGAHSITLPNDPAIKVLAVSVAKDSDDELVAANPLYDTLPQPSDAMDAPSISGAGKHSDSIQVSIAPGMYGIESDILYSTDGSAPMTHYTGPFWISSDSVVKARVGSGPVASARVDVDDLTPPKVTSAEYLTGLNLVELRFSEPVAKVVADNPASYQCAGGQVTSARLSEDGQEVALSLSGQGAPSSIGVTAVDLSPRHNRFSGDVNLTPMNPAFSLASFSCNGNEINQRIDGLPTNGASPWTMNFFLKASKMPEDHTEIAGFGDTQDRRDGAGRFICEFKDGGIRFWGRNVDIPTNTQFDLNRWQMLTVTYDGSKVSIYKDGKLVAKDDAVLRRAPSYVHIAPLDGWEHLHRFDSGEIANFTIWSSCMDKGEIDALKSEKPSN